MRKSKNYYKFLNYVSVGSWYTSTICKDNGVLECKSYSRVSYIEAYSKLYHCVYEKTIFNSDAELTFENVLVNNEVIYIYYLTDVGRIFIGAFSLDNYNTQKELKDEIHKRVVEFFLNDESFCEHEESTEDSTEYKEISDFQESIERDRINNLMETHSFPSISDMYNDKCFCCPADRPGNRCCGEKWCAETWKRYEAIINPEWHHVSLATLANIDFDMLDEKRKVYLSFYKKWQEVRKNLKKCSCGHSYERCYNAFRRSLRIALDKKKISKELVEYFDKQISMVSVECGVWSSAFEVATGQHESRKYNRATLRY